MCPLHIAQEKKANEVDEAHNNGEAKASDAKTDDTKANGTKVNDTKAAPQSSDIGVGVEPSGGPAYMHSRKLSPIAPVFVPRLNQDPGKAIDASGESSSSAKKQTKGLSASAWA